LGDNEKYDFEFKDYAPNVFKKIREFSNIKCSDYIKSISDKFMLLELSSPGKSGSFFYFSPDYRYLIKTVHYNEHRHFFKVLDKYYNVTTRKLYIMWFNNKFSNSMKWNANSFFFKYI